MLRRLKRFWWVGAIVVVVVLAAAITAFFVVFPAGADDPETALLTHIEHMTKDDATMLVRQPWGEGELLLVRYVAQGERRLGLGFAIERMRGWRVAAYTEQIATTDDVGVGSLLIASHEGGDGQPAWSTVVGELSDQRVSRVEVTWADGATSTVDATSHAYIAVTPGVTEALEAVYLAEDGTEIARVPV